MTLHLSHTSRLLRRIAFSLALAGLSLPHLARAWDDIAVRGEFNSWGSMSLTQQNGVWRDTLSSGASDNPSEFKFYSSNNGGKWFGDGSFFSLGTVKTLSDSGGNSSFDQQTGKYYTFTAKDASGLKVAVQVTAAAPTDLKKFSGEVTSGGSLDPKMANGASSIANNVNTIKISTMSTPGADEKVCLAYSTDNFASNFNVVQATGSGNKFTADIPAQPGGTTVHYYTMTSTMTGLTSGVSDQADLLLKALRESSSSKESYTTYNLGNAFHIIEQTAGSTGEKMLAGSMGPSTRYFEGTETEARIYSGNVYQNADPAKDQSEFILHYKIGWSGVWDTIQGAYSNSSGNDKYWVANLDLTGLRAGQDIVYYYLEERYNNADPTFVYAQSPKNPAPYVSGSDGMARMMPFHFIYGVSAVPEAGSASLVIIGVIALWARRRSLLKPS